MPARPIALNFFTNSLFGGMPLRPITAPSHTHADPLSPFTTRGPRSASAPESRDSHRPGGTADRSR